LKSKKNNLILIISLLVICGILITATSLKSELVTPVRKAVSFVLTPLEVSVSRLGVAINNLAEEHKNIDELKAENAELQNTIDRLVLDNTRLQEDNLELDRLRALYKMDQDYGKFETIGARVIAQDQSGWFNIFRIDRGQDDGVAVDMNIIANGGLIGIVTEVGPNYAIVRSIIDDSSRVSAMAMQSSADMVVEGNLEQYKTGRLILKDIRNDADVKSGDMIVTSNVSSKYLPGILIGYAADISLDANTLTKSGYLVPVATFDNIQEVLVITRLK